MPFTHWGYDCIYGKNPFAKWDRVNLNILAARNADYFNLSRIYKLGKGKFKFSSFQCVEKGEKEPYDFACYPVPCIDFEITGEQKKSENEKPFDEWEAKDYYNDYMLSDEEKSLFKDLPESSWSNEAFGLKAAAVIKPNLIDWKDEQNEVYLYITFKNFSKDTIPALESTGLGSEAELCDFELASSMANIMQKQPSSRMNC